MYELWSCVTFYHLLNRFPQLNGNCISTSQKWFNVEVYRRYTWFHFQWTFLNFWIFIKKYLVKRQDSQKLFWRTRKILNMFKKVPEKRKSSKAIWVVLAHLKPKIIFSVSQPWWSTFFWGLAPSLPSPPPKLF